jgi:CubicO group peptidase (beta-lactamase class C family)
MAWAAPVDGRDNAPGLYFCYSNLNYGILATVMERASGKRFDRFMKEEVLGPLGIDGGYNVNDLSDEGFAKLAALYRKAGEDEAWKPDGPWLPQVDDYRGQRPAVACRLSPGLGPEALDAYEVGSNGAIFSPQGGLRISARDLARIVRLFIGRGEVDGFRLLSRDSVERMMTRQWAWDPQSRNGELYNGLTRETGLGLARTAAARDEQGGDRLVESGGPRLWGHHADAYGLLGGMLFEPDEGYGYVYLIGGTARQPEGLRGRFSSWFLWEEEIQSAILEAGGHAGKAHAPEPGGIAQRAGAKGDYQAGLWRWRGAFGELGCFSLTGLNADGGILSFDAPNAKVEGGFLVGEATSPVLMPDFPVVEAIPSWNGDTPEGCHLAAWLRGRCGEDWTAWYALGEWASGSASFTRRSIDGQADGAAEVKTDTLVFRKPATALQYRIRLLAPTTASSLPSLRNLALAYSSAKDGAPLGPRAAGDASRWGRIVEDVPTFSQMVYPDGGNTWCSPTCVAMVMAHWEGGLPSHDAAAAELRVRRAVAGVHDVTWGGCGNWSFNAAFAGSNGHDACVARFTSLASLEPFISAGIPVVLSVSWDEEKGRPLHGAPVKRSAGHLTLLVGFDAMGDPVMNEPCARDPSGVRLVYRRSELETRWLEASGGTVYLIVPRGKALPGMP